MKVKAGKGKKKKTHNAQSTIITLTIVLTLAYQLTKVHNFHNFSSLLNKTYEFKTLVNMN